MEWTNEIVDPLLKIDDESSRLEVKDKVNNLEEYNKVVIDFFMV